MPRPSLVLATSEEVETIAERTLALLEALSDAPPFFGDEEGRRRWAFESRAADEALRFCATAAGWLKDLRILCWLALALQNLFARYASRDWKCLEQILLSIEEALQDGEPVSRGVVTLARHEDPKFRAAVARGLTPRGDAEISLLEELSLDSFAEIRSIAREHLAPVREIPWWRGKFSKDPTAFLSPEEEIRLKPIFEQLSDPRRAAPEEPPPV